MIFDEENLFEQDTVKRVRRWAIGGATCLGVLLVGAILLILLF